MKGSSRSVTLRIRVVAIFAVAFLSGAIAIFGLAALVSTALRVADLPLQWRMSFAAAGLVALALVDLLAIRKDRYCPLGWRRQTPKPLIRRYAITTVAMIWGFDTGLAVTTFRVAAITWGALAMASLGLSSWWIGFGYGLGFVVPLLILILMQASGARSDAQGSLGSMLERLLRKRMVVQLGSAVLLFIAGTVLLTRV